MTISEKKFWSLVRRRGVNDRKFLRQYVIKFFCDGNNESCFIVDFVCLEINLVIEIDGEVHQSQREYDRNRDQVLEEMGFVVIRFTNHQIQNSWPKVVRDIMALTKY